VITRTYQCLDCGDIWDVDCVSSDPAPDCPYCAKVLEWRPGLFSITTVKAKAVDYTQQILEEDYGLSNFRETPREGDVSGLPPPPRTREQDQLIAQLEREARQEAEAAKAVSPQLTQAVNQFFPGVTSAALPPALSHSLLAGLKVGPYAGVNAMDLLHKAGRAGKVPTGWRPIAKA
jgi:DNA-directed RNA polymerase subunit RPC12/RpoP